MKPFSLTLLAVLAVAAAGLAGPAWAADAGAAAGGDWWEPITGILDTLTSGGVQIGGVLLGVGIIIAACWGGITGRMDWQRVGMILAAGVLIFFGPSVLKKLFNIE